MSILINRVQHPHGLTSGVDLDRKGIFSPFWVFFGCLLPKVNLSLLVLAESFQAGEQLPETLQLRLIHLFGAILSGSKVALGSRWEGLGMIIQVISPKVLFILSKINTGIKPLHFPKPLKIIIQNPSPKFCGFTFKANKLKRGLN